MQWLEGWGVDANFIFTIEEKTSFNPGVSFNTPMQNAITSFPGAALPGTAPLTATSSALTKLTATTPQLYSFGIGGGLSSDAYRQDKLHILYNLSDLIGPEKDLPSRDIAEQSCRPTESANASIIIDSDLKLDEWLQNIASIEGRKQGKIELPNSFATSGVLSHEIRFEVVTSGNITPVWHLVRVSANTGTGNLFNTSRDRTQDLILTFGPIKNGELHSNARAAANTGDLGATIGNVIRILP
jgi:hypothetical protein